MPTWLPPTTKSFDLSGFDLNGADRVLYSQKLTWNIKLPSYKVIFQSSVQFEMRAVPRLLSQYMLLIVLPLVLGTVVVKL